MIDLTEATTDDLFKELSSRFVGMVFAGYRVPSNDDKAPVVILTDGDLTIRLGLGVRLAKYMDDYIAPGEYEEQPEPETEDGQATD